MTAATLELRVLAGLQAGARLPLGEGRHVVGGGATSDIVLMGAGVEAQALMIEVDGHRLHLRPGQPGCGLVAGDSLSEPFVLEPGVPFHVGDIWLVVDLSERPWPENGSWLVSTPSPIGPPPIAAAFPDEVELDDPVFESPRGRRWLWWLVRGVAATCLVGAVTLAWMRFGPDRMADMPALFAPLLSRSSGEPVLPPVVEPAPQAAAPTSIETTQATREAKPDTLKAMPPAAGLQLLTPRRAPSQAVREAREAVSLLEAPGVSEQAAQPMIHPVRLPFSVRQVVCGSAASITTGSGVRVFERGSHMGYQLMRAGPDRLRLRGPADVEMPC